MPKGSYGYINSRRKRSLIQTLVLTGISLAFFTAGYLITKTPRNLFSIIAAIGAIPVGLSVVNLILILKARPLSAEAHDEIEAHKGGLLIRYELEMTSYERTWHIGAATVLEKNVILYTEEAEADTAACEKHIREQLAPSGYGDYTIKVYPPKEFRAFLSRLDQLENLRRVKGVDPAAIEDSWQVGTTQTPAGILLSISL